MRRSDYDPLANRLDFSITGAVERAGSDIADGLTQLRDGVIDWIKETAGIDLTGVAEFFDFIGDQLGLDNQAGLQGFFTFVKDFLGSIDFSDPPTPEEAWQLVVSTFIAPLNMLLGPDSPLDASKLFGQIQLPQFGGGVSITDLTTAVSNLLQPFTAAAAVNWGDGWSYNATTDAAQVIADGTTKSLWLKSGVIKVEPDQPLNIGVDVKYSGVVSGAGQTIRLVLETYTVASPGASDVATPVTVAAITNPSGTITTPVTLGHSAWPIPPGVQSVRPVLVVDELATAGVISWLNTPHLYKSALGVLASTLANIQTALNNAGQATRDAIANALGHPGTGHTPADIVTYLMNIPQGAINGLEDVFGELADILDDQIVDPLTEVGNKLKDLVHRFFFGGGPDTVVSQKQIAEPSGIVPTDANTTIPWIYLPPELTPAAIGHPWVELTKVGSQTISSNTVTKLTAFSQAGGFPLTDTSSVFAVPFPGLFHVKVRATWANTPETTMRVLLYKNGTQYRMDNRFGDPLGSVLGYNEVAEYVPLDAGDTIEFRVFWLGSGSTKDISVTNTYARITYIGATHLTSTPIPTPTVTFDAKGTADNGSGDASWIHTFGANAKTIVIPYSHETPDLPTITCGPYNVPVLSGPTYIGTYFGFNARYSLAAAILPDAVKGTTQTITVDFPSGNAAFSGNSLSFNDVAYLGAVRGSSDSSSPRLMVPSNAFSQVAGGFGGMDANFSSFNRTQDNIWNFSAGNTWSHVMGHAQGGLEFMASGGKWAGKFIELHP